METLDKQWVSFGTGDDRPDIEVRRACNRCFGSQVALSELDEFEIVSRYGTVHKAGTARWPGHKPTDCGIDTSGPAWWHRS